MATSGKKESPREEDESVKLSIALVLASSAYAQNHDSNERFTVKTESIPQVVGLDGVVQPVNQGSLAAQTSGRVVGLYVDVNDFVKDQVLLEISAVQQSAALDAAQAQLASATAQNREAQAQLNRYRQLFPKGAISKEQMDSAEARARSADAPVKSAQAAVEQAKESLGYTNITAPYDGIVTQRMVELGETIAPALLRGFRSMNYGLIQKFRSVIRLMWQMSLNLPCALRKVSN